MKTQIVMEPIIESFDIYRGPVICLTDFCNMKCLYCSRDCSVSKWHHLPLEKVIEIIEFFSKKNPGGQKYVQLTGGEVLVYPDIFTVIEYVLKKGFICRLQTNGLLLKKAVKERPDLFSHPSMVIKISLDGWNRETHGHYRGVETFTPIVKGVESALSINSNVGIKTVVHERNFMEIGKMLDLCNSLGVKGWSYNTLMQRGRAKQGTFVNELAVTKKLVPKYNQLKYCRLLNGSNVQVYHWMNVCGKTSLPPYFFIMNNGDVFVTDKTDPERKIGSVFDTGIENQFCARRVLRRIDLTVSDKVLQYVASHLKVGIEKNKRVCHEKTRR